MNTCAVDECIRESRKRGWCHTHYMRWWRSPNSGQPSEPQKQPRGVASPTWKGDDVTYIGAHARTRRTRGPARAHPCTLCGARAEDWAYDHKDPNERIDPKTEFPYSTDVEHYIPLCKPCHWKFDRTAAVPE